MVDQSLQLGEQQPFGLARALHALDGDAPEIVEQRSDAMVSHGAEEAGAHSQGAVPRCWNVLDIVGVDRGDGIGLDVSNSALQPLLF